MNEGPPAPKRVCIAKQELELMTKEELQQRWQEQDSYIDAILAGQAGGDGNRQQYEAARRENILVMRLTTKEQEMQEIANQIEELKRAQNPNTAHLRAMLLDPAINLMFQRMKKEMDVCREKLEQAQNDLAAWKFTPDGQTGKRLMAKCRMLLQENEELGKVISSGRTAKLEGEIALEKKFVEEMKASQAETDEFLVEMDEDVEGMQSTIYVLQQQLKEAKEQITKLQEENAALRTNTTQQPAASQNQTDSSKPAQQQQQTGLDSSKTTINSTTSSAGSSNMDNSSGSALADWTRIVSASQIQVEPITVEPVTGMDHHHHHMVGNGHGGSSGRQQQQPQQKEEAMDTSIDSSTGCEDNVTGESNHHQPSHNTNSHSSSSQQNQHTDYGKNVTDSPLSPVRTSQSTASSTIIKGNNGQSVVKTEGLTGGGGSHRPQTDIEPIQNGLISSQYDSQDDER